MAHEIHIVLADDHPIFRKGLREIIEAEPDLRVIAELAEGKSALEEIKRLVPQIAILDIDMQGLDGIEVARSVRALKLAVEIIFLTVHREEAFLNEALEIGAKGYVLKDSAITDIISSIRAVSLGQYYTSPAMTSYLIKSSGHGAAVDQQSGVKHLTVTEQRILRLIAEYKTSREIAEQLFISYRTVQTHRANISQKLDIKGSHALMKFALTHKSELSSE
jgi:DNA-binding NarL/FixJ family response regulator